MGTGICIIFSARNWDQFHVFYHWEWEWQKNELKIGISTKLIPTIVGQEISLLDRQIFGLATRD